LAPPFLAGAGGGTFGATGEDGFFAAAFFGAGAGGAGGAATFCASYDFLFLSYISALDISTYGFLSSSDIDFHFSPTKAIISL